MLQTDTEEMLAYFTDVENLRDMFAKLVADPELPERVLVIHGVGGVGKSWLLDMFALHCKKLHIPVGLTSGDRSKSAPAILSDWANDLETYGITLPHFSKNLRHYHAIQAKVEDKAKGASKIGDFTAKFGGKFAETAAGNFASMALGLVFPGINIIVSVLGGAGAEILVSWLLDQGFTNSDIRLLRDPTKNLTNDFLNDIKQVASGYRLVLMLDTFEQLTTLDDWMCEVARQLNQNVILVIAGRIKLNWSREWPSWLEKVRMEELEPMTDSVMRTVVCRYYATMRGGEPDPVQVEAIVRFGRGLPIVVATAVRLWVLYDIEDFEAVKAEVVADLLDRLKQGVPKEMMPLLEAAAIVRRFDKSILRAVAGQSNLGEYYDELRRFPFVRPRGEALALHDVVREIMDEYLRIHDPERYNYLHERAAEYFEMQVAKQKSDEAELIALERLYHRVLSNEEVGILLFQEIAEELTRYRLVGKLSTILSDMNTYRGRLVRENSCQWLEYYNTRLADLELRLSKPEIVYQAIAQNESLDPKLRAYALCDWGTLARRNDRPSLDKAIFVLEQVPSIINKLDSKLVLYLLELSGAYRRQGRWDESLICLEKARELYEERGDSYMLALTYQRIKFHYLNHGEWRDGFKMQKYALEALSPLKEQSYLKADILGGLSIGWVWAGLYLEAESNLRNALDITERLGDIGQKITFYRDLGLVLGMQGRIDQSDECFSKSIRAAKEHNDVVSIAYAQGFKGLVALKWLNQYKAEKCLTKSMNHFKQWPDKFEWPLLLNWLGMLYELRHDYESAQGAFEECRGLKMIGRLYWNAGALTGLVRVKYMLRDYAAITTLFSEAEKLAQQYEYNDYLASLRLTQGHIAWDEHNYGLNSSFEGAFRCYQHALIHALRYNRFLLDEALSGGSHGTPLQPIIPHCQKRGYEGQQMLMALREWWRTGANDIDMLQSDTISPIPNGISLLEAERIAREREPGNGSQQKKVMEQFDIALSGQSAV